MATPFISTPFLILSTLFILLTTTSSHPNNYTDLEALLAFKKSIHDDQQHALSSWNETTHFCRWNGVTCSKKHPNRVISVILWSQGLVGSLSPHIGNLSFLRIIDLQNNTFSGPIPQEIGRLRRIRVVELGNNFLGGGIPSNLSRCMNLYYLNLVSNELTGGIVPEIASLVNLQSLGLSRNMLSGTIPPFLGNLTDLFRLSLSTCSLQGEIPESIARLRKMRLLIIGDNDLTGSIPFSLYNLTSVEVFAFAFNRLHGNIPSDIGSTLPKLRILYLHSNHFTGALPASLSNSSQIERVALSMNSFTGNILIDFTRLSALEKFLAEYNRFNGDIGSILSSLTNCTNLEVLTLADNHFTGSLPDSIGNLSDHLFLLTVRRNQLSGIIPSSIGNLVGLTSLIAHTNNLKGPIPSTIGKLHKLQEISFSGNRLTDEVPFSLGNLTLLNYVYLGQNNLSGTIPQSLGNCSNLLSLDLSYNNLSGSIPPQISKLSSIAVVLNLSHNVLTGTIPSEVGTLRNLAAMDLSYNRLSGTIPTSLGSCVVLSSLRLGRNALQGEIPESLRDLRGLEYLDLSHNNLSGLIPKFLVEFHLLYLNLSFNVLEGDVPTLGVFRNESAISLEGNQDLCGGIAALNLSSCPSSPKSNKKGLGKILVPTVVGAICLALAACFCVIIIYKRRTLQNVGTPIFQLPDILRLSYGDLLNATNGFLETNLVGAGRFGSVYKGTINDDDEQTDVAVKVLNLNVRGACKSLASECNALRGIRHRNLLKIVSVCDSTDFQGNDFKALVYEFVANGSLENWLHSENEGRGALSATQRLNIAIDIASAVEYLHFGTDSIVIHGDLKPSNILLDEDMVAKVGDFGLAKIVSSISQNLSSTQGSSSSAIKGTIGYIAPEYGMSYVASTQGDVYSYGVLVLEMFTNRRPTSDAFEGCLNLQDFVSTALTDRVMEVVDPFFHRELNVDEKYWDCIVSILRIGVRCSKQLPRDRMSMTEVVNDLKKIRNVFPVYRNGRNVAL